MQGLAATTATGSLPFLAPRYTRKHHSDSPILNRYVNQRVSFPRFDSFPKLKLSANSRSFRQIAPLSAIAPVEFASASSNKLFAHGLRPLSPSFGRRQRVLQPSRAFKDGLFENKLPEISERPEWWWRTLACIPYLISLQISDVGFYVQPFLKKYDAIGDMIYFIPGATNRWPSWSFMLYSYLGCLFVVKNKELPHFPRFHMMMGLLLQTALQIIGCSSNFFPLIHSKGWLGMYYWMAIGFAYICLLLECIRCALAGVYPHIPYVTDAASSSIHTKDMGLFSGRKTIYTDTIADLETMYHGPPYNDTRAVLEAMYHRPSYTDTIAVLEALYHRSS